MQYLQVDKPDIMAKAKKHTDILTVLAGGKSVAKPSAQTTTLCAVPGAAGCQEMLSEESFQALCSVSREVARVYSLQRDFGLRISEVLAIRPYDITNSGMIHIRGLKGSGSVLVSPAFDRQFFAGCRASGAYPFQFINRFYVYRVYKRFGLSHKFEGNKKCSVTHLPRHDYALQAKSVDEDQTLVTSALRHKSSKNDSFYVKEK